MKTEEMVNWLRMDAAVSRHLNKSSGPEIQSQDLIADRLEALEADNARLSSQWQAMKDETLLNQEITARVKADKAELLAGLEEYGGHLLTTACPGVPCECGLGTLIAKHRGQS